MKTKFQGLLLLLLLTLPPRLSSASVAYPGEVKEYFGVDTLVASPLGCTLCHSSDQGGNDTVVQPYGRAMLGVGAKGSDVGSLKNALEQLESIGSDSDRDGATDADEIRAGTDPNQGTGETVDPLAGVPLPQTGCAVAPRVSRHRRDGAGALAGSLVLALYALRRRRR
jgi:hypothetical protein